MNIYLLSIAFWMLSRPAWSSVTKPQLSHARRLLPRDSIDFKTVARDPFDHSWIKEWAALGDSFASAPGAGKRTHWWCSRYDGAYGNLINNDQSLGSDPNRKFNKLPCLGYTMSQILNKEVNTLSNTQMMITMSAGGNDVLFSDVVDACTYQYFHETKQCDVWLQKSRNAIEGDQLPKDLDSLAQAAKRKLAYSNSKIFWTAYAIFFDTTSTDCDGVTWTTIWNIGSREYLTQARRNQMNDLVDLMNDKLRDAVKRAGDNVVFVEWESRLDDINGKHCEPGVDESSGKGDNRETLAFYEWYSTLDDQAFGNSADDSRVTAIPNVKSRLDNDSSLIGQLKQHDPDLRNVNDGLGIASILSDKSLRLFYPQSNAQQRMASAVLSALEQVQAHELGQPSATTTAIGCTASLTPKTASAIESAVTSTVPPPPIIPNPPAPVIPTCNVVTDCPVCTDVQETSCSSSGTISAQNPGLCGCVPPMTVGGSISSPLV